MHTIEEPFADHFAAIDWIRENQPALENRSFAHIMAALSSGNRVNADWRYSAAAAEHALKRLEPIWQELERHWQQLNAKEQLEVLKTPEIFTHSHHMECMDLSFMTYLQDESKPPEQRRPLSREYVRSIIIFALRYGGKERIEKLAETQEFVPSAVKSL